MQNKIEITKIISGVYWVEIAEINLRLLCGCPADTVKHLKKRGLIDKITKNGVEFESGPNAILLSDKPIQNGELSNLAEFPLLQMLYLQGMIIPNHVNNTGEKPLIIGSPTQLKAQIEYFYRGNYGLVNKQEILEAGIDDQTADFLMKMKLRFAFGKINNTETLINAVPLVDEITISPKKDLYITRLENNLFEVKYQDESVIININLPGKEVYPAPYTLNFHKINREYFSIIHTGEGDAWDINRPCMASIIMFQGKIYLIDAGPDLMTSLNALGISVNEVDGIFNTHGHDDHFAGLMSFVRSDHKIKYFASSLVRASVAKKLCGLMGVQEESFYQFFDVCDLKFDVWNNVEGLEIMPLMSPHPVETNIFYFRTFWDNRYYTYGHLADVVSFRRLHQDIVKESDEYDYKQMMQKVKDNYLLPADLKKIDIGGGMIHGDAGDYREDETQKIMLAHIARGLNADEKQVGSFASFGNVDSLVETNYDFSKHYAYQHLKFYFPNLPDYEIFSLLNCPIIHLNSGADLFKKGAKYTYVYLILTGLVEMIYPDTGIENTLSAGSLVGFYVDNDDLVAKATCRASCHVTALQIPINHYLDFMTRQDLVDPFNTLEETVIFFGSTSLFNENMSLPVSIGMAQNHKRLRFDKGDSLTLTPEGGLYLIRNGQVKIDDLILEQSDFFGTENVFLPQTFPDNCLFTENTELWHIPFNIVMNIPIVYWKMLVSAERRKSNK